MPKVKSAVKQRKLRAATQAAEERRAARSSQSEEELTEETGGRASCPADGAGDEVLLQLEYDPPFPPPSPGARSDQSLGSLHKTSSSGTIEEFVLDTGVLKKRISSLFKSSSKASSSSSSYRRQDSDLGYQSQGTSSPLSPPSVQHAGHNGHVTNGLPNGCVHRDLSIEEELENRLVELSGVARKWKTRWRQERDSNQQLQEQFAACERECRSLVDSLQGQYEEYVSELEERVEKSDEVVKQLTQQKTHAETQLRKVMSDANKESTKFKQELQAVQKEVSKLSERMKRLNDMNKKIEKDLEESQSEKLKVEKKLTEEKTKLSEELKVATYDSQSKVKAAEMQTELYKTLLDIALNKLKLLEEHVCPGRADVVRRPLLPCTARGRYVLRVNSQDPTSMLIQEEPLTSGTATNHDAESVSSEDLPSSSKRTSFCSSVNISENLGSEANLPSLGSSPGSIVARDEVFCEGPTTGAEFSSNTFPRRERERASSEGGPHADTSSDGTEIRPRTSTIGSPPRDRVAAYKNIVSPSCFKPSIGQLVQASTESVTGFKVHTADRVHTKSTGSTDSMNSASTRLGKPEISTSSSDLARPKEKASPDPSQSRSVRTTTLRELKRKKSDSHKYKGIFHGDSSLQRQHKYRSVGDLIKGITGDKRRSSREENPADVKLGEDHNNNHGSDKLEPTTTARSKTLDTDSMPSRLLRTLQRKAAGSTEALASADKRLSAEVSRQASDVSNSSRDAALSKSGSTDDVAGTRTSGFSALRSRRNGMVASQTDFKDISKHLRKKQRGSRDLADILKRWSRDGSDGEETEDHKTFKRRSKVK